MTLLKWNNALLEWSKICFFMWNNPSTLKDSDADGFFNFCTHISSRSPHSRKAWIKEFYPKFVVHFDRNGSINSIDYTYVYTILLHYTCSLKPQDYFINCIQKLPEYMEKMILQFLFLTQNEIQESRSDLFNLIFKLIYANQKIPTMDIEALLLKAKKKSASIGSISLGSEVQKFSSVAVGTETFANKEETSAPSICAISLGSVVQKSSSVAVGTETFANKETSASSICAISLGSVVQKSSSVAVGTETLPNKETSASSSCFDSPDFVDQKKTVSEPQSSALVELSENSVLKISCSDSPVLSSPIEQLQLAKNTEDNETLAEINLATNEKVSDEKVVNSKGSNSSVIQEIQDSNNTKHTQAPVLSGSEISNTDDNNNDNDNDKNYYGDDDFSGSSGEKYAETFERDELESSDNEEPTHTDEKQYINEQKQMMENDGIGLMMKLFSVMKKYEQKISKRQLFELTSRVLIDFILRKLEMYFYGLTPESLLNEDYNTVNEGDSTSVDELKSELSNGSDEIPENELLNELIVFKTLLSHEMIKVHFKTENQSKKIMKQYKIWDYTTETREELNKLVLEYVIEKQKLEKTVQKVWQHFLPQKPFHEEQIKALQSMGYGERLALQHYIDQLKISLAQKDDECLKWELQSHDQKLAVAKTIDHALDLIQFLKKELNKYQQMYFEVKKQSLQKTQYDMDDETSTKGTQIDLRELSLSNLILPQEMPKKVECEQVTNNDDYLEVLEYRIKWQKARDELEIVQQKLQISELELKQRTDECRKLAMLKTPQRNLLQLEESGQPKLQPQQLDESLKLQYHMQQENRPLSLYEMGTYDINLEIQKQLKVSTFEQNILRNDLEELNAQLKLKTEECEKLKTTTIADGLLISNLKQQLKKRNEATKKVNNILANSQIVQKQHEKIIVEAREKLSDICEKDCVLSDEEDNTCSEQSGSKNFPSLAQQQLNFWKTPRVNRNYLG